MRFFNTEGPVDCERHYCLPPLERLDMEQVMRLIEQYKYFLLHAPRQTGKTSCLLALAEHLNGTGRYRAVYANIEAAQAYREDVNSGMTAVVEQISRAARDQIGDQSAVPLARSIIENSSGATAVDEFLTRWCQDAPLPTVLLLDEVDSLVGDTLISLLRQLRAGYPKRPSQFPQSVILCGVRDLQDYRIHSSEGKSVITGGSAFNIKAQSLRLGDFDEAETRALLLKHTAESGQSFTPGSLDLIWHLTAGQPWLVNALAYAATFDLPEGRDRSQPLTEESILAAKERLILARVTHLDQLADKLKEPRVRRVVESILAGDQQPEAIRTDDITYVRDLGLIKTQGQLTIANPIYQEVIPRELTYSTQLTISQRSAWYVGEDGRLDLPKLLAAFQQFFRENSEIWLERFDYKEAGPHLLMQAFLQRIINGGGRVEREYGLGRKRTDLLVIWPHPGGVQRGVIELKVLSGSLDKTLAEGLAQTWEYTDRCGGDESHLIIFDRRAGRSWAGRSWDERSWDERIWQRAEQHNGLPITVWGM